MKSITAPIEKLTNILRLEAETYQDKAVLGGLSRYADTWVQEGKAAFGADAADWVEAVANRLQTYSDLPDTTARQQAMAALLEMIEIPPSAVETGQAEKPLSPPTPIAKPAEVKPSSTYSHTGLDSSITTLRGVGP
ncbi:MAG: hypothetical protein AB8I69_14455, partial [Anaerolineae bacterium]